MKILIVEDNRNLAQSIARVLKQQHFSTDILDNGLEAEEFWSKYRNEITLVILDLQLPGKDGFEVCKSIRDKKISTPIIMLTAKDQLKSKVNGLNVGADDYLTKPFEFEELLVRIKALLRRPKEFVTEKIQLTPHILFNSFAKKVMKGNSKIYLTAKEFKILEFLVHNRNRPVSQQEIFDHCFDFAQSNWSNTIEVHIKNLRKKLFNHPDDKILKTIRRIGYILEVQ